MARELLFSFFLTSNFKFSASVIIGHDALLPQFSFCLLYCFGKKTKKKHVRVMFSFTLSVCVNKGLVSEDDRISSVLCLSCCLYFLCTVC